MNIQRIKALTWVGTLAVGATLGWSVYDFLQNKQELAAPVSLEDRHAVLNDVVQPPQPKQNLVDYDFVTQSFHNMNWTGEKPPVVIETTGPGDDEPPPPTPVAELLSVLVVQVDMSQVEGSLAFVKYIDTGLAAAAKEPADYILRVGRELAAPHSNVEVSAITAEGVEFSFADAERETELVPPVAFPSVGPEIVKVGPDGVIMPDESRGITVSPNTYKPEQTVAIGKNEFILGTEDVATMGTDYSKILSQDIRTRIHRDKSTGQVDGLEITKVKPGSLPAGHGISEGEVLKSINGHKVTSKADAINFVKKESDHTDTWVAVFEKRGREIVRTYHSPED